jgi:hypothetical protein
MPATVRLEKAGGDRKFIDFGIGERCRTSIAGGVEMLNTIQPGPLWDALHQQIKADTQKLDQALGTASLLGVRFTLDPSPEQKRLILRGVPDDGDDYQGLTWFSEDKINFAQTVIDDTDDAKVAALEIGLVDMEVARIPLGACTLVTLIDIDTLSDRVLKT